MSKIHTSTVPHDPADRPDMSEWMVLAEFCMFWIQNCLFEVISKSFCIIFRPGNSWARWNHQKTLSGDQKLYFRKNVLKKNCFPYVFLWFPHFGSKIGFLTQFLNDSAWFCLEKLEKHVFFRPKALMFNKKLKKSQKSKNQQQINEHTGFPRVPCGLGCYI